MFGKLYLGEIKKLCRPKTAIVFAAIIILAVILMTVVYAIDFNSLINNGVDAAPEVIVTTADDTNNDVTPPPPSSFPIITVNKATAEYELALLKTQLDAAKKQAKKDGFYYYAGIARSPEYNNSVDMVYALKASITAYEFALANPEYLDKPLYLFSQHDEMSLLLGMMDKHTTNYIGSMLVMLSSIIVIYGLVVGSGAYATEIKSGTLKLVLLRPITRNQLTTAKLLALLTIVTIGYVGLFLLLLIIGALAFTEPVRPLLFIFNASAAYVGSETLGLFFSFCFILLQIWAYSICAFFIATATKSRVLGIILPYASTLATLLINFTGLGRFWFSDAINLGQFFGYGNGVLCGGNFAISIVMYILYIAAFIAGSYAIINKRDIA